MFILIILLLLALFSLITVVKKINEFRATSDDIVIIGSDSKSRKVSSSIGKYVDFKEKK